MYLFIILILHQGQQLIFFVDIFYELKDDYCETKFNSPTQFGFDQCKLWGLKQNHLTAIKLFLLVKMKEAKQISWLTASISKYTSSPPVRAMTTCLWLTAHLTICFLPVTFQSCSRLSDRMWRTPLGYTCDNRTTFVDKHFN